MGIAFPGESSEYRAARDRLLEQEIELRRAMESAAAARRELPPGGVVPEDYVFQGAGADGTPADVRLSELFAPGATSGRSSLSGTSSTSPARDGRSTGTSSSAIDHRLGMRAAGQRPEGPHRGSRVSA